MYIHTNRTSSNCHSWFFYRTDLLFVKVFPPLLATITSGKSRNQAINQKLCLVGPKTHVRMNQVCLKKKTKKTPKKRKEKRTLVLHRVPTIELSRPALQVHLRCHLFSHREEQVKGVFSQGFSHNLYIFSRCFLNMLEAKYVLLMYYW